MPQISVIVPVYKVEEYIHRCVDSILNQTYTDFELILVDDGSPDNCGRICDEYAEKDERVVVIHQENGGLSAARNAGIDWVFENSNSEWVTFIDSDDWVADCYLEILFSLCQKYKCDISVCRYKECIEYELFEPDNIDKTECLNTESAYVHKDLFLIQACGKLYKKVLFSDIRFPVGKIHEDRFTTHLVLFKTNQIAVDFSQLYFYFINENGISHSEWSPKRLDDIEAVNLQLKYFLENKYYKAYNRACVEKLNIFCIQFKEISNNENNIIENRRIISRCFIDNVVNSNDILLIRNFSKGDFSIICYVLNLYFDYICIFDRLKIRLKIQRLFVRNKKRLALSFNSDNCIFRVAFPLYSRIRKFISRKYRHAKSIFATKKE